MRGRVHRGKVGTRSQRGRNARCERKGGKGDLGPGRAGAAAGGVQWGDTAGLGTAEHWESGAAACLLRVCCWERGTGRWDLQSFQWG